ncbi:MAG: glycosyltransferase [Bacteroidales bacterium]|nr:glycosyltransferase [Bacteroidales bacterium]
MIHLFFFVHDHSGARTYADELLSYLITVPDIKVHKVFFDCKYFKEYTIEQEQGIVQIHLPSCKLPGRKLDKYSERCLDLMDPLIKGKENLIFHLNDSLQVKLGIKAKERFGAKLIYTLHFLPDYFSYFFDEKVVDLETTGDTLEREMVKKADQIICVTRFAKKSICNYYNVPENKVVAIHNGYGTLGQNQIISEIEKIKLKADLGFNTNEKLVLFVGLLEERKGLKYLVQAFNLLCELHKNIRLVIVGNGNYDEVLKYAKSNWGNITLTGKISSEEVNQLYQVATIGVIPSVFEQCSYVALEMMSVGLPMVVASAPGLNELYDDGVNAIVVPLKKGCKDRLKLEMDASELNYAIDKLINDPNLQKQFKETSTLKWQQQYTARTMGFETLKIYNRMIEIECVAKQSNIS